MSERLKPAAMRAVGRTKFPPQGQVGVRGARIGGRRQSKGQKFFGEAHQCTLPMPVGNHVPLNSIPEVAIGGKGEGVIEKGCTPKWRFW